MATEDGIVPILEQFYTTEELVELLRDNLRYARLLPPGPERNQRRRIARLLRARFKDKDWQSAATATVSVIRRVRPEKRKG